MADCLTYVIFKLDALYGETLPAADIKPVLERLINRNFKRGSLDLDEEIFSIKVRDLIFRLEDELDKFEFDLADSRKCEISISDLFGYLLSCNSKSIGQLLHDAKRLKLFQHLDCSLRSIAGEFKEIAAKHMQYCESLQIERSIRPADIKYKSLVQDNRYLVGMERPSSELIKRLNVDEPKLCVISVVGMGGVGKTTLVKKVFNDWNVKHKFERRAWLSATPTVGIRELLKSLIKQLSHTRRWEFQNMPLALLEQVTHSLLFNTSYLIILDDMSNIGLWKSIRSVLPSSENSSRVILTTRIRNVAMYSSGHPEYYYEMGLLSEKDSMKLLHLSTFHEGHEPVPEDLVEVSKSILKKCAGLPLAIVAVSGLLNSKTQQDNLSQWNEVNLSISDDRSLRSVHDILSICCNNLPAYLKACFLYMSIFPEDYLIGCQRLIRLWAAEQIIEKHINLTPEEVGAKYICELLVRNLVQQGEIASDGRIKTLSIHPIIREIMIIESKQQNFVTITDDYTHQILRNTRRLSEQYAVLSTQKGEKLQFQNLRSLFIFYTKEPITRSSVPELYSRGFKLLTVLDLQGTNLKVFPTAVVKLFNLRYLSLKHTDVQIIPNSIGKLQKLQTLDLKHTLVSELPSGIVKLKNLRNLLVYRHEYKEYTGFPSKHGFSAPINIQELENLQNLCSVEAGEDGDNLLKGLESLTQLRRLGIKKLCAKNSEALCRAIDLLKNLESLTLSSSKKEQFNLNFAAHPPQSLRRLYLTGGLDSFPSWISKFQNLAKIFMKSSMLKDDPLFSLQDLPSLVHIELFQVYSGNTLAFKADKFRNLKILGLHEFESLEMVLIEEKALHSLERLVIQSCALLKTVPSGIEYLENLKVVDFINMPKDLTAEIQKGPPEGKDYQRVQHISVVNSINKETINIPAA